MTGDVLVVGGGAIGWSVAWRLASAGCEVAVVDPEPGSGASGVAAGMLAPVTEARWGEEDLLRLGLASLARWPGFVADLVEATPRGRDISYRTDGTVVVALDADDRALLRDETDRQRALGLDVDELPARELRRLEPGLAPAVRRGVRAAAERAVDPPALVAALRDAAGRTGVALRRDRVTALTVDRDAGRVTGVELAGGEHQAAATVVLAAGAWAGDLAGLPGGVRFPVRPVKGQVVTLRQRPGDTVVHHTVRGRVHGSEVYVVPRDDGRVVCGATMEERGWDATVTAGAAYELLRDVLQLLPGLDDAELVGVRAGFRPATPDDLPLVGPGPLDGLVVATGHFRNGILLAPVTADGVVAAVTGAPHPAELAPCDPGRFTAVAATTAATTAAPAPAPSASASASASASGSGSGSRAPGSAG